MPYSADRAYPGAHLWCTGHKAARIISEGLGLKLRRPRLHARRHLVDHVQMPRIHAVPRGASRVRQA